MTKDPGLKTAEPVIENLPDFDWDESPCLFLGPQMHIMTKKNGGAE